LKHTDIIELSVGKTRSATRGFSGEFSATDSARKMNNQPEEPSGTTKLAYDYRSRVTGITYPSLATNSLTYNGLDTRTSKTDSGGTKGFLRDGASVTDPVLSDSSATYTPGISESRSGVSTFYGQDQLGSVTLQTNTSSSITYKASYDAFGAIKSSTGSTSSPFGFAGGPGYQQDSDSGLMLLGHRYYDSSAGRFLTRDPVKDGSNWYDYVGNNPVTDDDCSGLEHVIFNGHAIKVFADNGQLLRWVPGFSGGDTPEMCYDAIPAGDYYFSTGDIHLKWHDGWQTLKHAIAWTVDEGWGRVASLYIRVRVRIRTDGEDSFCMTVTIRHPPVVLRQRTQAG